jgi:DtxR family Mn-dependent transcriptional regulator
MELIEERHELSTALEDYLETIFELVRDQKFARVKDIAKARGVRSASVSPAMKRLAELGMIRYVRREYIDLTPEGEHEARRIYARHQVLTRFFRDILKVPAKISEVDACEMEHSLSNVSMDHLVMFFEFLEACPEVSQLLSRFHGCSLIRNDVPECEIPCESKKKRICAREETIKSLKELQPGERGRVTRVDGVGAIRQRLLDMGIMPDLLIELERVSPAGDPIWIKFQGSQLSLRRKEAESVLVAIE